ncbi:MAG: 4-hydroxythreonine-4-phosphate dehydrogenase PdxA [Saprospiraceae bacterium]|nr:4-hydroxythreonine-4-phosphate dehydrogenase PdxA [Saprospiraceae bacterium]
MYHDQALIPSNCLHLSMVLILQVDCLCQNFSDHGTGYDIVGKILPVMSHF